MNTRFVDRVDPIIKIAIATCERFPCICIKGTAWQIGACLMRGESAVQAYKAALAEAGLVIVPREPTEAMVAKRHDYDFAENSSNYMDTDLVPDLWRAMIDAAPKEQK